LPNARSVFRKKQSEKRLVTGSIALLDESEELALSQQEGREELFERV